MTQDTTASAKKSAPAINTVTMTDGKIVEFVGNRKILKGSTVSADGKVTVRMDFANGEFREFTIPDTLFTKFAAHGAEQKLGDSTAGLKDIEDAILAVDELVDQLYNGDWSARKESGGMAGTSVLVRALVESSGQSVEKVKAFLADKTQAQKMALRNSPKIKPIVERIEAEKAGKGPAIDADALLQGLGG